MADNDLPSIVDFSEDLTTAEAPTPLPAREFRATIVEAAVKLSRNDNKYAAVKMRIAPEDYPADYDTSLAPDGTELLYNRVVLEDDISSRYRARKFIEAIGGPLGKRVDVNSWIGLECQVTLAHEEWEGAPRATIKKVDRLN